MSPKIYKFGDFILHANRKQLFQVSAKKLVKLRPKAFNLLFHLIENRNITFSKEDLLKKIWSRDDINESALTGAVMEIRTALFDRKEPHKFVENVTGQGYFFKNPVDEISEYEFDEIFSVLKKDENEDFGTLPGEKVEIENQSEDFSGKGISAEVESSITSTVNAAKNPQQISASDKQPKAIINDEKNSFNIWREESGRKIERTFLNLVFLSVISSTIFLIWGIVDKSSKWAFVSAKLVVGVFHLILIIKAFLYYRKNPGQNEFRRLDDDMEGGNLKSEVVASTGYENALDWARAREIARGVLKEFRDNWISLLITWIILYLVVFLSALLELSFIKDEKIAGIISITSTPFTTLINNFSSLFIFLCFSNLNEPITTENSNQDNKRIIFIRKQEDGRLLANITLAIIIWFVIDILIVMLFFWQQWEFTALQKIQKIFLGISGVLGGIAMALLVARFQSKFLKSPKWLLPVLFSYTVIQALFIYFGGVSEEEKIAIIIIINGALFLKGLLILYVIWLFQSGRLLFYLVRVRRANDQVNGQWNLFRGILKQENKNKETAK